LAGEPDDVVTCSDCGNRLEDGARFCERCGRARNPEGQLAAGSTAPASRLSGKPSLLETVKAISASRYDVRGEIGRGGMAAVFVAQDLRLNRRVALKVMLPGLAYTEGMAERFEQEARTAANLDHPNIVTIFGVEEIDDLFFFVMKYVEGRSLDKVTRDVGALPIDVVHYILLKVSMALAYAHDEGVVHRDVKPGNVLLDRRGTPVVTDFGIAKAAESPSLTVTGSIIGTPAYMSPEQFMGKPALPASDQYALGIMAYEMLAGELPFQGSMVELQLAHLQSLPTPIDEIRRDAPAALAAVVMRMLHKDPRQRFLTLHEAEDALRAIPLDEATARGRLVELGFLASATAPYGLASTPLRTSQRVRERVSYEQDAAPSSTPAPAPVAYVRIDPIAPNLRTGEIVPLHGAAYDADDTPIPGKQLAWELSPAGAGRINADGTLTVLEPGALTLSASCDGKRSLAEIQVTPLPVNRRSPFLATAIGATPVHEAEREPAIEPAIEPTIEPPRGHVDERAFAPHSAPAAAPPSRPRSAAGHAEPAALSPDATSSPLPRPTRAPDLQRTLTLTAAGAAVVLVALLVVFLPRLRGTPPTDGAPAAVAAPSADGAAEERASGPTPGDEGSPPARDGTLPGPATAQDPGAPVDAPTTESGRVSALAIDDPPTQLRMGERVSLRAVARGADGAVLANERVTWRSSNARIASIDAARGEVRALRPGRVTVSVRAGAREATFGLQVAPPTLSALAIGDAGPLTVGESATLRLVAQSDAGRLDDAALEAMGATPRWSSSAPDVVRIDARSGQLRALARGSATLRAEVGTLVATTSVTVTAAPASPPVAPAPAPADAPVTSPPAPSPAAARSESDVTREIEGVLREYATAVSARDLTAMLRHFPAMAEKDRGTWRQFFRDGTDVAYALAKVDLNRPVDLGEEAQVTLTRHWSLAFTLARTGQRMGPTNGTDRVTVTRSAGGWRITRIQ